MRLSLKSNTSPPATAVLILAAGMGKRMKSEIPKGLTPIMGAPMLSRILREVSALKPQLTGIVVGHKGDLIKEAILNISTTLSNLEIKFATQAEQRGTGDAALVGLSSLGEFDGLVLIMPGDVPLIHSQTLQGLVDFHERERATVSFVSFKASNPKGYGRIIRDQLNQVAGIVEEKDCSAAQKNISEVNSGIYCVESVFLKKALDTLELNNNQAEIYLTDIIGKAAGEGQTVAALCIDNEEQFLGVNDQAQLSEIHRIIMSKKVDALLESGVRILDRNTVYVEESVSVGADTELGPNVQLRGKTIVGKGVTFEGSAYILNSTIEDGSIIKFGVRMDEAHVGKNCSVGPFAHLRPETKTAEGVKIGNFVEIKKSNLNSGAKVPHLTYIGDAEVGSNANVGAGTITCNYDGYKKSKTIIGDAAFIGSNASLVAPVTIGAGAVIGAGSVITKDVSPDALAVERSAQKEVAGWGKQRRNKGNSTK